MRFAKVPEWLPAALIAVPRERSDAAPAVALMAFVVLAARADFRTWRVPVRLPELAAAIGQSERTARRAIDLLERVEAIQVADGWGTLAVENCDTGVRTGHARDTGVIGVATGVTNPATGVTTRPPKAAGQGTDSRTPQTESFPERYVQHPLMAVVVSDELPEWMRDEDPIAAARRKVAGA